MPRFGLFLIILVMIIGLGGFFSSTDFGHSAKLPLGAPNAPILPNITFLDPQLGAPSASTTIIEFGDFTCPFCRDADIILRTLVAKHPHEVRLVWKDFPNNAHNSLASTAAVAGRCAQKSGKFEIFRDWAFTNQENLNQDGLREYLKTLGLSDAESCLNDPSIQTKVAYTTNQGNALQIDGTPYLLINNQHYTGPITLEALEPIIATK